jgi:hypothetical protein
MAPFHLDHLADFVVTLVVDNARRPEASVTESAVPLPALRRCALLDFKKSRRKNHNMNNKSLRTPNRSVNRWESQADVKALSLLKLPFQGRTSIVNSVLNSPSLAKNRWNSESEGKDLRKSPSTTIMCLPFQIRRQNSTDSACSLPIRLPSPKYNGSDRSPRKPRRLSVIDTTALLKEALDISESSWNGNYSDLTDSPPGHLHHHHSQQHQLVLSTE